MGLDAAEYTLVGSIVLGISVAIYTGSQPIGWMIIGGIMLLTPVIHKL